MLLLRRRFGARGWRLVRQHNRSKNVFGGSRRCVLGTARLPLSTPLLLCPVRDLLSWPFHCRFRDKALGFRWKRYEEYLSPGDARVRAPVLDAALTGLLLVALHLRPAAHRTRVRNRFPLALACVHEEDAVWRRKERRWRRVPDVSRQVKARVRVQPAQRHRERARVLVFGHDCAGGTTRPTERSLAEDCVQTCSDFADLTREIAPGRHALLRYRPNGSASYKNACIPRPIRFDRY